MDMKKFFKQTNETNPEQRENSRMNTLEVQVKQLLQFEKQARPLLLKLSRQEEEKRQAPTGHETLTGNKEYEHLLRKVNHLEQVVRQIKVIPLSRNENPSNREEHRDEAEQSAIRAKIAALETNFLLLNEVQAVILKQIAGLSEKLEEGTKQPSGTEDIESKPEPLFKTLYIDKLFLDRYEQNNNFAQLGIKELSGALNIGATYGKDVVPKEVSEQIQEDVAQMKAMKEQMYQKQSSGPVSETEQQGSFTEETDLEFTNIQIVEESSHEES
ncbi:hypothetical protein [Neobacillus sp. Marseille-QA0830]